jgi:DNA-binding transcriptional LysR family regulator
VKDNIRSVDLNLLVVLEALYDEQSVTRAADRLALTQPTVSGMLKRLRGVFNDDLFVRTSHGIVPTPRAAALIEPVKQITATAQSLLHREDFDPVIAEFTATLCGSEYTLNTVLSIFAGEILRLAPRAKTSLVLRPPGNIDVLITRGEIDFLITVKETAVPGLPTKELYADRFVCLSSYASHTDGQSISLDALCACRHVILNPRGAPISKVIDKAIGARGKMRNLVVDVPSYAAVFQAMRASELIAFVPRQMAWSTAPFKVLKTDLETPVIEIVAQWHPRMANDARHIWLRDLLMAAVEKISVDPIT